LWVDIDEDRDKDLEPLSAPADFLGFQAVGKDYMSAQMRNWAHT
jgi:hypothetical protein